MSRIVAEGIGVSIPIFGGNARSVRRTFIQAPVGALLGRDVADVRVATVEALSDISFDLVPGDRLALIGHNGAGKSTLLRVLAGIYEPTAGYLRVEGRVVPLLDIMAGMNPLLSGRENIRMAGLLLGYSSSDLTDLEGQIIEFSELGDYIDLPMRTYSSGMKLRLAFAVATSRDSDVLLLDEWLSVGDVRFVEKANARLQALMESTKIIVFASHSQEMLQKWCNRALLLKQGRMHLYDSVNEAFSALTEM